MNPKAKKSTVVVSAIAVISLMSSTAIAADKPLPSKESLRTAYSQLDRDALIERLIVTERERVRQQHLVQEGKEIRKDAIRTSIDLRKELAECKAAN